MTDLKNSLTQAFQDLFSTNRGSDGRRDHYGITITNLVEQAGRTQVQLTFTFLATERYCCMEPGCHFSDWDLAAWQRLRKLMIPYGIENLPPLLVSLTGCVEAGNSLNYTNENYTYEHLWDEAAAKPWPRNTMAGRSPSKRYILRINEIQDGFICCTGWLQAELKTWQQQKSKNIQEYFVNIDASKLVIDQYLGDDGSRLDSFDPRIGDLLEIKEEGSQIRGNLIRHIISEKEHQEILARLANHSRS